MASQQPTVVSQQPAGVSQQASTASQQTARASEYSTTASQRMTEKQPKTYAQSLPERPINMKRALLDVRKWTRKTRAIVAGVGATVTTLTAVGVVLGMEASKYPDYSKIDYALKDTYQGDTFFDKFDYFSGYDPAAGLVHYVDSAGSMAQNLTSISDTTTSTLLPENGTAIIRVDTSDKNATTGRKSVRITSKATYSSGLFIFDVIHSPFGCATWPALWLTDNTVDWPRNGEIDIMEAVNMGNTGNQMTLHTSEDCKIGKNRRRKETGKAISYDCWNVTNGNEGCGVQGPVDTFGEAFNTNGGGIYAMELRNEGIRVWMFNHSSIPSDLVNQKPDPSTWGTALADFPNLECDIGAHFKNLTIIANIDLCGNWAGQQSVFNSNPQCTGTCKDWVANNASAFDTAYWEFGGFWVYENTAKA